MMYDVVVVGAGPAGLSAAKRASEAGLKTLVLEKRHFPRPKVCDGLMGSQALSLVGQVFGELPETILCKPSHVTGMMLRVPGQGVRKVEHPLPLVWRENLDSWLCEQATRAGVEVREGAKFLGLRQRETGFSVRFEHQGSERREGARFVIGADGAVSRVRRCVFPDQDFHQIHQAQECFKGELDIERDWYHEFLDLEAGGLFGFSAHYKDDWLVLSYAAEKGRLQELVRRTHDFLANHHGFDPNQEPVWVRRCLEPEMAMDLASRRFLPARGNVLLVGDAAGVMFPVGEGIGPSVKSGMLAAAAVTKARETGQQAAVVYLSLLEAMIAALGKAAAREERIAEAAAEGGAGMLDLLIEAWSAEVSYAD